MQSPIWLLPLFTVAVLATLFFLYRALRVATPRAGLVFGIILLWLSLQALLGWRGFYVASFDLPPRFLLAVMPPLMVILFLFLTPAGRAFVDRLPAGTLAWLHAVRIPVEISLYGLFLSRLIPEEMTFEGRNFDILAGLSAPLIAWFGYARPVLDRRLILAWNVLALGLLVNIVTTAILATPYFSQIFGFDLPNVGVLHYPFIWLPALIVPAVLLSHLTAIRQLTRRKAGARAEGKWSYQ
jgi:hypothetical protein